jgi:cation diffusion facilitator CzcD-associated flavoprotein CzcO
MAEAPTHSAGAAGARGADAATLHTDVLVIGAGPAGLAIAGCLVQRGLRPLVIERAGGVAASWRSHYERLHLHTVKALSALPGRPFPDHYPRYVPRQALVDYLVAYAEQHAIAPLFGEAARAITPVAGEWRTVTDSGRTLVSRAVVLATGANCVPRTPLFDSQAMFSGRIVHSHAYRNAAPFAGQNVLVVGMGNTGAEIALDLTEQGVRAALSVRSPLNIVHRDVLGQRNRRELRRPAQHVACAGQAAAALGRRGGAPVAQPDCGGPAPLGPADLAPVTAAPVARVRQDAGDRRRHAGAHQGRRDRGAPGH